MHESQLNIINSNPTKTRAPFLSTYVTVDTKPLTYLLPEVIDQNSFHQTLSPLSEMSRWTNS